VGEKKARTGDLQCIFCCHYRLLQETPQSGNVHCYCIPLPIGPALLNWPQWLCLFKQVTVYGGPITFVDLCVKTLFCDCYQYCKTTVYACCLYVMCICQTRYFKTKCSMKFSPSTRLPQLESNPNLDLGMMR